MKMNKSDWTFLNVEIYNEFVIRISGGKGGII